MNTFYVLSPTAWTDSVTASGFTTTLASGTITVTNTGNYMVYFDATAGAQAFRVALYNSGVLMVNVPYADVYLDPDLSGSSKRANLVVSFMAPLNAADALQVYVQCTSGAGAVITFVELSFVIKS